jgi:hypothetical protein
MPAPAVCSEQFVPNPIGVRRAAQSDREASTRPVNAAPMGGERRSRKKFVANQGALVE